jgi:hypothetical protein
MTRRAIQLDDQCPRLPTRVSPGSVGRLRAYCLYGSRSQAQLDGCMSHVTTDDINRRDTQAARFARGDTSDCLEDAGPFCERAAQWNAVEPDRGP